MMNLFKKMSVCVVLIAFLLNSSAGFCFKVVSEYADQMFIKKDSGSIPDLPPDGSDYDGNSGGGGYDSSPDSTDDSGGCGGSGSSGDYSGPDGSGGGVDFYH